MYKILESVYQGGKRTELPKIDAVINLMVWADGDYIVPENVKYRFNFPIEDGYFPGMKWLKDVIKTIDFLVKELNLTIYIHCRAGHSRSAMVTIAYLMYSQEMSFSEARDFLGNINENTDPNPRFCMGLKEYEIFLKNK